MSRDMGAAAEHENEEDRRPKQDYNNGYIGDILEDTFVAGHEDSTVKVYHTELDETVRKNHHKLKSKFDLRNLMSV